METTTYLRVVRMLAATVALVYGQDDGAEGTLLQKLSSEFTLAKLTPNKSDVVTAGTAVTLLKFGMVMYSTDAPLPPLNTYDYKKHKITESFGHQILGTILAPGNKTTNDYPHREFRTVEKLWVIGLAVRGDGVVFTLYSDPYDDVRYYGDLKFPFEKGATLTADQELARIEEVVYRIDPTQLEQVAGRYTMGGTPENHFELNADGTFSLSQAGHDYAGPFVIQGDKLMLRIGNGVSTATLQGATVTDPNGKQWVRQETTPASQEKKAATTLKLPAAYASAQSSADQLQLNADKSLSLQVAGQTYHGTFSQDGNTLKLHIPDTNTEATATIDSNKLTDSSGQTWILRDQSSAPAATEDALRNQDVIDLAKGGIDDATILAKIANSKCQFDTSTTALIQLKKSGVSAAVIKAMVGAGK
jgi:hypothetical protein